MLRIVMLYDGGIKYGPETERINRAYADANGYDFVCYRSLPDPRMDIYWNRVRIFQQELDSCDTLWWFDADAFFVRHDQALPYFTQDLAFSTDWNGICCGVMALQSTSWTSKFLTAWSILGNVRGDRIKDFDHGQFREQTTVKALMHFWPFIECHVHKVDQAIIQNVTSHFAPAALALHMWNNYIGTDRAVATIEKFKAEGYKADTCQRPPQP